MKKRILCSLVALMFGAPLLAQAAEGWVVDDITLQAGPDMDFPALADLEAGTPVSIQGCIDGWRWCDVIADEERGWVPGSYLEEEVGGRPVVVIENGPRIGIPIISFSLGAYWGSHYHNRPFYSERHRYESHAIAASAPPRPARVVATAPRHDVHVRARTDFAAQVRGNTQGQPEGAHASQTTTTMQRPSRDSTTTSEQARVSATTATDQHTRTVNREAPNYRPTDQKPTDTQPARRTAQRQVEPQPASPTDTARRERPAQQPQPAQPEQKPPTAVAQSEHARPESGRKTQREEPKPKDELKKPNPKGKNDKDNDNGGG
jgi:uncharacterized protein YraI